MRIAVIGATGGIGTQVTRQALAAGYEVVAPVRNPARIAVADARLAVEQVNVFDTDQLATAIKGADAVVSSLGPRKLSDGGVLTEGVSALVPAMAAAGVRRLVIVSADGAFTHPTATALLRYVLKPLVGLVLGKSFADVRRMESKVRASELDWTIVRPPRLTDAPYTGRYRTALDGSVRRGYQIARADVAHAILRAVDAPELVGHVLGVAR